MAAFKKWVLLDEDGEAIRYFDYPAKNTVEIKVEVKTYTFDELLAIHGECLL